MTVPIAVVGGLLAGLSTPIENVIAGDYQGAMNNMMLNYAGWDNWNHVPNILGLQRGLLPLLIGGLVHKFVGGKPIGVNAMLARSGVPLIRV